jgi:hemolysin activation/secretion protein
VRLLILFLLVFPFASTAEEAQPFSSPSPQGDLEWKGGTVPPVDEAEMAQDVPAGPVDENPAFDVYEYRVEGNTVLPPGKVEEAVYPFLGEGKTIADVEGARAALEKAYQGSGYPTVFVNIPEQEVDKGIVRLQVQESTIERLRVTGAKYYSLGVIKERVAELAEGNVPYYPEAQKQIAGLNRQDRKVAPVLRPGKSPGKVEVELKVDDRLPFHGGIELNNRYSPNTTHPRINGSLRYDNLWQRDHSLGISFQVSPENTDESRTLVANYLIPRLNGDYLALYGVLSRSDVAAVGDVGVIGNGNIVGMRYIHPLPAVENYIHSLILGVDYKDFDETTELQGADSFNTPISYLPFTVGYEASLLGAEAQTQISLGLNFSIRGVGNDMEEFLNKRFQAFSDYAYLRADFKHTRKLPGGFGLFGRVQGQVASGPLISNEQFAIGGADSVRGYLESNSLGDDGAMVSMELRSPSYAKYLGDKVQELYGFVFADAGHVRIQKPLPAQEDEFNLASVGAGLRLKGAGRFSGGLDYAVALHDAGQREEGDSRLHFRIGYDW